MAMIEGQGRPQPESESPAEESLCPRAGEVGVSARAETENPPSASFRISEEARAPW